jgi:hypothetical protein
MRKIRNIANGMLIDAICFFVLEPVSLRDRKRSDERQLQEGGLRRPPLSVDRLYVQPRGRGRTAVPPVLAKGKRQLLRPLAARPHDAGRQGGRYALCPLNPELDRRDPGALPSFRPARLAVREQLDHRGRGEGGQRRRKCQRPNAVVSLSTGNGLLIVVKI